jgi:hypothetical protein
MLLRMHPQAPRRASLELWRRTLSQVPTCFGRLLYLAGLRNTNSGKYEHHGFIQRFGEDEAQAALRESHEEVFAEWLACPLPKKQAELEAYLASGEDDLKTVLAVWARTRPYATAPPASALETERMLYLSETEALLALLRDEAGVSVPGPDE